MDTDLTEQRLKMSWNHDYYFFNYMKFLLRASKDNFCYHLTNISGFNNNVLYWLIWNIQETEEENQVKGGLLHTMFLRRIKSLN